MSFWQSINRKNIILSSNQAEKVFEVDDILIEKRSIWFWMFWLFVLWLKSNQNLDEIKFINLCKQEKCLFIQIETFDIDLENLSYINFKSWYYKKFITPYTAIIDLSKSIDEILASMKPKWRYNIKLAEKKWVEVFEAEKTDENIKIFYDLVLETTSRDNFFWNTFNYYKTFLQNPDSKLFFAKYNWETIASWIFIFEKEFSIYYYWASTSKAEYRNLMAPYLVQYKAILKAIENWSKYYDFLWVATPNDKKSSLLWVTDFKTKFTNNIINISKSYIWINNKFLYFLIINLKKLKNIFK